MNGLHLVAENYAADVAKVLIAAGCPLDVVDKEVSYRLCLEPSHFSMWSGDTQYVAI